MKTSFQSVPVAEAAAELAQPPRSPTRNLRLVRWTLHPL